MKIQFTQNGKVVAERKAFVAADVVMRGDGWFPGVDFDRDQFDVDDVIGKNACWLLMETAYVSMNEGEEYQRDLEDGLGFQLLNDNGTLASRADVEQAFRTEEL